MVELQQQCLHLCRPESALLYERLQFPQQVGIAEGMCRAGKGEIARPAVMHGHVGKVLEQGNLAFQGLEPSMGTSEEIGEQGGANHVQPLGGTVAADARLIEVGYWRSEQGRFGCLFACLQGLIGPRIGLQHRSLVERVAIKVFKELTDVAAGEVKTVAEQRA